MQIKGTDLGLNGNMLCGRCPHRKMRAAEIGMRTEKLIRIKSVPGIKILHVHDENSYCPLPPLAGEVAPQGRKG